MKAFVSHSSIDKHFVRPIADELGDSRAEFDEYSFEYTLNNSAIRSALRKSSIFVLILSQNSVKSFFVNEEIRNALESRGAGRLKKVLIFAIDGTSYRELPEWLREINVAIHIKSPKHIASRIDAYLTELSLEEGETKEFYLGREEQESELTKILARPKSLIPAALHLVGTHGIGRRTLLRNSLKKTSTRHYGFFCEIYIEAYEGVNEFYRKFYDLMEVANPIIASEAFEKFKAASIDSKIVTLSNYLLDLAKGGGFLILVDEGGVYQDSGEYQTYFPPLIDAVKVLGRPALGFIQTRMMREILKTRYPHSFHIRVPALKDESVYELLCLQFNDLDVEFTEDEVRKICQFTDGYPNNINFVANYIRNEGMAVALNDPREIEAVKQRQGDDFLRRIELQSLEQDVLLLIHDYRYCDIEFIMLALDETGENIAEAVRNADDLCCVERRDRMISLSPLIKNALRRDPRFDREAAWYSDIAARIVGTFASYEGDENISISLIDSAIPEMIRQEVDIPYVTALILPSHYLRAGRDYYDRGQWTRSIDFCNKAMELQSQLTPDAKIEANRLLGLAIARTNPSSVEIPKIIRLLNSYSTSTARRVAHFIEGFRNRKIGNYEIAKSSYEEAYKIEPNNYHINRELSSVLCKLEMYSEAEPFARSAFQRSPDNAYIMDVLIDVLEGKRSQGAPIDSSELARLKYNLQSASEIAGKHFHKARTARDRNVEKDRVGGVALMTATIAEFKGEWWPVFNRGEMYLSAGDIVECRRDIQRLQEFHIPEALRYADKLEVQCRINEGRHVDAKDMIERTCFDRPRLRHSLEKMLSNSIMYSPKGTPADLLAWAKGFK